MPQQLNLLLVKKKHLSLLSAFGAMLVLTGCHHTTPPECVVGTDVPTPALKKARDAAPRASSLELAFDGSASVLGFTASGDPANYWRELIKVINQSAAATGVDVRPHRVGGGSMQPISSWQQATQTCFYQGCGQFRPIASSLDTLWQKGGLGPPAAGAAPTIPLRLLVTDLEANGGDIANIVKSIRPHVNQGAVIGVVAMKLPFNGSVYNSNAEIIFKGETERPIYLIATGPQSQVNQLLKSIKNNIAMTTLRDKPLHVTQLAEYVSQPTQTGLKGRGSNVQTEAPLYINKQNYSNQASNGYIMAKMNDDKELLISSTVTTNVPISASLKLGEIEPIGPVSTELRGEEIEGTSLVNGKLVFKLSIPNPQPGNAVRIKVARGDLPEQWWIDWTRTDPKKTDSRKQTEGLRPLMTNLAKMLVDDDADPTPAASLCLMYSN